MKKNTTRHWKMSMLAKKLEVSHLTAIGIMESLWHFCNEFAKTGELTKTPPEAIAAGCFWDGDPIKLLEALVFSHWVDRNGDKLGIHDWNEHCEDATHASVYRSCQYFWNGVKPTPKKLPKAEQDKLDAIYKLNESRQPTAANGSQVLPTADSGNSRQPALALALALASNSLSTPGTKDEHEIAESEFRAAIAAFDGWFSCRAPIGRDYGVMPEQNDAGKIQQMLDVIAQEPPVIHGGRQVPRQQLVPLAIETLRKRATPMKSVEYAIGAVKGVLAQWSRDGPPQEKRGAAVDRQPRQYQSVTKSRIIGAV